MKQTRLQTAAILTEAAGILVCAAGILVEILARAHVGLVLITGGSVCFGLGGFLWVKVGKILKK